MKNDEDSLNWGNLIACRFEGSLSRDFFHPFFTHFKAKFEHGFFYIILFRLGLKKKNIFLGQLHWVVGKVCTILDIF